VTQLCVPIFVQDKQQAQRDIATASEAGADYVELRLDGFAGDPCNLVDHSILPTIITYRAANEGGISNDDDRSRVERLSFFGDFAKHTDVELETLRRTGATREQFAFSLIVSTHDFKGRPSRLYNIIDELNQSVSDINKIVWMARSIRDNIEAFEILQTRQKPTIALCMGEAGLISRILAKKFGAFLTFASLRDESATAPGQVTIQDMKSLYRWDAIGPKTKVFGVVACPVRHSMSPAIHNASFDQTGYDGIYLPMLVQPEYEAFKAFMESFLAFEPLDLTGLSITIPHKENALRYLKEKGAQIEPLAERIGAVNTIVIDRSDGRLRLSALNTDYAAILDAITDKLNIRRGDLANYRVAVIGAGGTGRTAVAALAACGATVVVYNRTRDRADALAKEFDGHTGKVVSASMEKVCDSCCHIFINTTSVGMHPNVDDSPLGDRTPNFTSDTLVFDAIYNPMRTKLLAQAEQSGAKTIGGVEMFVRQAAAQFKAWTGLTPPKDVMRSVIVARLTA
jgi:3-dehydroquinate dehydratase/shikimate dehydrogenase